MTSSPFSATTSAPLTRLSRSLRFFGPVFLAMAGSLALLLVLTPPR